MQRFGSCTIHSATIRGVEAVPVDVEVVVSRGMPGFSIVGMADAAIQEAKERIRAGLQACGFTMPPEKVVVSLVPGSIKKTGTGFDLPIAVGLLVATGQIDTSEIENALVVGELSLTGEVRGVPGMLSHALCAKNQGLEFICGGNGEGLLPIMDLSMKTLKYLGDLRIGEFGAVPESVVSSKPSVTDFVEIAGHQSAKRVLQIAALGRHNVLFMGPPGSGKTLLASALPGILPQLSDSEMLECAVIYSVAGLPIDGLLSGVRPFRAPHHSSSMAGLVGGGKPITPGEFSLAHNGVLFLDELAEFKPSVLQTMRQPIESGKLILTRADGSVEFPTDFMLVAASNPCPCGYYGDDVVPCTCSQPRVEGYQNRIGGPLLDRFDLRFEVARLSPKEMIRSEQGATSEEIAKAVSEGVEFRSWREGLNGGEFGSATGDLGIKDAMTDLRVSRDAQSFFEALAQRHSFSGRAIKKALLVSRSIADLEQSLSVDVKHIAEAARYRVGDKE